MGIPKIEEDKYYTFEEYLALEEVAEEKHEYHNGKIFFMAGGTGNHSIITSNLNLEIGLGIRNTRKNCTPFSSDMKVKIDAFNRSVYPDLSVVCGSPNYTNPNKTVLSNPMLIIEVLAKSTRDYDKNEKFEYYRSLPSFKEYVIVYQTIPRVQTWYKEAENLWRIGNAFGLEDKIYINTLDTHIELKYIYENVEDLNLDKAARYSSSY